MQDKVAWMRLLPVDLDCYEDKDFLEPPTPLGSNEIVIGDMTRDCKAIYTIMQRTQESCDRQRIDCKYWSGAPEQLKAMEARVSELYNKAICLQNIFWVTLRDTYGLWESSDDTGVRQGFKVVTFPRPPQPPFFRQQE